MPDALKTHAGQPRYLQRMAHIVTAFDKALSSLRYAPFSNEHAAKALLHLHNPTHRWSWEWKLLEQHHQSSIPRSGTCAGVPSPRIRCACSPSSPHSLMPRRPRKAHLVSRLQALPQTPRT